MISSGKGENLFYLVIWALVFALVPMVMLFHLVSGHDQRVEMQEILHIWAGILPFFILFLIHNYLLVRLIRRHKGLYIALTALLVILFGVYCFTNLKGTPPEGRPEDVERVGAGGPPGPPPGRPPKGELREAPPDGRRPMTPETMQIIMGILVLGVNLGVRTHFKSVENERRMMEMQSESLGQKLETLRYQINPHFFMNTLNNIHALVDIDPGKAKESIEEFSKLMRIVLYDGNEPTIPLERELDFIRHYASLMRLRYPESVEISLSLPETASGASVPPLLMASFVENAFKHGISYQSDSFVRISVETGEGKIVFRCANSRNPSQKPVQHGLGLENARKRLDLMYGSAYTLQIDEREDLYDILLVLPAREGASA